jgi:hypothetical protein
MEDVRTGILQEAPCSTVALEPSSSCAWQWMELKGRACVAVIASSLQAGPIDLPSKKTTAEIRF